jgi:hypothetical protein
MVDVVSIVIAVISFVGTLLTASVTAWFAYFSDERKRLSEAEKLIAKYRDPLLLAAQDLQSRLYNITDWNLTTYFRKDGQKKDYVQLHTAFLVGQYFSWIYILRQKAQFLRLRTDNFNKKLTEALGNIAGEFATDEYDEDGAPFMLWRGEQMAMGEVMTIKDGKDGSHLFCMGYAAFRQKWREDRPVRAMDELAEASGTSQTPVVGRVDEVTKGVKDGGYISSREFRRWFGPIVEDITKVAEAKNENPGRVPDQRLRRLQHLLFDLICILDDKGLRSQSKWKPCHRAETCNCSKCAKKSACPCGRCEASPGRGDV